jgi:probable rRNA maturation factor
MTRGRRAVHVTVRHPALRVPRAGVERLVDALDREAGRFRGGCPAGELSVVFLTDEALAALHAQFLDDPAPTDVITFEPAPGSGMAGEICVSADAAARVAGRGARAFSRELALYVVHGWLHLAGYDDLRPAAKRVMRRAEARAMAVAAAGRVLPRFVLA